MIGEFFQTFQDRPGHHLTEIEEITKEHPNALEQFFEDVDDYVYMLPV